MSWTDYLYLPRNIQRLGEILQILIRNGLGHFVHRLNLQEHLPFVARLLAGKAEMEAAAHDEESVARRVATALQQLGPTFVKMGQMLSSRPDLIPESFVEAFRQLQDHVEPFPAEQARQVLDSELGERADQFESIQPEPFASGSIAQVHHARLRDGSAVVVKIRRPGIEKTVLGDIAILSFLAQRAQKHFPEFNPKAIVAEFDKAMRTEMDFVSEGSYTTKFCEAFKDHPAITCPEVYWDLTTSQVLTLQCIKGISVSDTEALRARGVDLGRVASALADAYMKQFFVMGMFHADPHPGNLLVMDDGTVAMVDFGLVGHLTSDLRNQLVTMVIALARQEVDLAVEAYIEIGEFTEGADPRRFKPDLLTLLDKYYGMPLKRIRTQNVFAEATRIARNNGMVLPRDLILLGRAFVTITSVARQLDPDFDISAALKPYTQKLLMDKLSPSRLAKSLGLSVWHMAHLLGRLPTDLRQIMRKLQAGSQQFIFKHEGLESFMSELDRASNRLSVSVILGAVVIGSSLIIHRGVGPKIFDISAFGLFGYLLAGFMGLWLAWDILRSGRY